MKFKELFISDKFKLINRNGSYIKIKPTINGLGEKVNAFNEDYPKRVFINDDAWVTYEL